MRTDLFDYHLPPELIAQRSVEPRDHSRLMVVDRRTGAWEHKRFFEIASELRAGDVLVLNETKVFRARLKGDVEVFLLRAREGNRWETLVRPGRRVKEGQAVAFGELIGQVVEKSPDGVVLVEFDRPAGEVIAFADAHGEIPIPPYVKQQPETLDQYQTIYARTTGSVAAPTAGFHFTGRLMDELKAKGVQIEFVTLHVGIGTFRPVKTETLEEHEMHSEFVTLDAGTAQRINQAKHEGRRVIAVGTTTVRTLEGVAALCPADSRPPQGEGALCAYSGDVNVFIKPGFAFNVVDGLITNFHLPKSTLLVLVSALAGREHILCAYQEAVRERYRFFSFGDAMFIR